MIVLCVRYVKIDHHDHHDPNFIYYLVLCL